MEGLGKEYFAQYAPIGCRDLETKGHLDRIGIENYLSGCMTLTIPRQEGPAPEQKYICLVDVPPEVEDAVRAKVSGSEYEVKVIAHGVDYYKNPLSIEERFKRVKELLLTYQNASCVVTSRLHSALPCLALETPVLLIFDEEKDEIERFDVFLNTLHHKTKREFLENPDTYDILNPPENKTEYLEFRNPLIKRCEEFVKQAEITEKTAPTEEFFTKDMLAKVTWQKEILKEAEHGFTQKSDELKAYLDELEAGRTWLEGQYNAYQKLAEKNKEEAVENHKTAEKYKEEAIENQKAAEKYKEEAIENHRVAKNRKIEAEVIISYITREKVALQDKYEALLKSQMLNHLSINEIFEFPNKENPTEKELEVFDFEDQPGSSRCPRKGEGKPLVSIISGFYNGAGEYLEQAFNSIVNQTFPWFEWIIINDGTTAQEDLDVLEKIAALDDRVRVFHQNNQGLSAARNRAIAESQTDLIMVVDTDDMIEPNVVEVAFWTMQNNPDAAWCYFDSVGFCDNEYLWRKKFSSSHMKKENLFIAFAAIRRDVLLKIGGYRVEKQSFYEDWYLWISLFKAGYKPVHIHQYSYWYRRKE